MPIYLKPEDILSVRQEWEATSKTNTTELGTQLFRSMFKLHPEVEYLYERIRNQGEDKLIELGKMIMMRLRHVIMDQLDHPDLIFSDLLTLGERHPGYGVNPALHSQSMRDAIFDVVRIFNGSITEHAWDEAWHLITCAMKIQTDRSSDSPRCTEHGNYSRKQRHGRRRSETCLHTPQVETVNEEDDLIE